MRPRRMHCQKAGNQVIREGGQPMVPVGSLAGAHLPFKPPFLTDAKVADLFPRFLFRELRLSGKRCLPSTTPFLLFSNFIRSMFELSMLLFAAALGLTASFPKPSSSPPASSTAC